MGKNNVHQIREFAEQLEKVAGPEVREQVMVGSEAITASTKPQAMAAWVQGAMSRLDALLDEPCRVQVMVHCGFNCATANAAPIDRAAARRKKFRTLDEFLEAEQRKPPAGTRLERAGTTLLQYYTPRAFTHSMRCYCGLLRGLPDKETVSSTYCQCAKGFVQRYWEAILERPVEVELLQSCVSDAEECKFAVHL